MFAPEEISNRRLFLRKAIAATKAGNYDFIPDGGGDAAAWIEKWEKELIAINSKDPTYPKEKLFIEKNKKLIKWTIGIILFGTIVFIIKKAIK